MPHNPYNTEINLLDRIRKAVQTRKTLNGTDVSMSKAEKIKAVQVEQYLTDAILALKEFS